MRSVEELFEEIDSLTGYARADHEDYDYDSAICALEDAADVVDTLIARLEKLSDEGE